MVEPSMEAAGIEPAQDSSGWIYVVRGGEGAGRARFKIGFASDPVHRLKALQVGSPVELELMGAIRGTRQDEADFHKRWEFYRTHGEWFRLPDDLLDVLIERGEMLHPTVQIAKANREWFDRKAAASSGEAPSPRRRTGS